MGFVYATVSAALFSLGNVLMRRGQRQHAADDGAIVSATINALVLAAMTLVAARDDWRLLNGPGLALFFLGGVMTTGLGRLTALASVRHIGASRAATYKVAAPVFTVTGAYALLGERLSPVQLAAAGAVLAGLWLLTVESRRAHGGAAGTGPREAAAAGEAPQAPRALGSGQGGLPAGVVYGLLSALFFGLGYVVRKQGLVYVPSAILGAAVGAAAGMMINGALGWWRLGFRAMVDTGLRGVPRWYVAAGIAMSAGIVTQFAALDYLGASVASIIGSTEPMWTMLLSRGLFPGQETVTAKVIAAALIIAGGVAVLVAV